MHQIDQTQGPDTGSDQTAPDKPLAWTVADCLKATGGKLIGTDTGRSFSRVIIDSRIITADDTHDGHSFIDDVLSSGVRGIIAEQSRADELSPLPYGGFCIAVEDSTKALGSLGRYHRRRNRASVLAITGSNGKTSTRQMTAAVVSQKHRTLSSRKNYNNQIGLPLTLLDICPRHRWAVVELGMNAPGEIAALAGICLPDIGVITNIGPAHLEGVGSIEGVMKAKGELLENMSDSQIAVLNADDERVMQLAAGCRCRVLLYGLSEKADIRAVDIRAADRGNRFRLETFEPAPGRMNVQHIDGDIHLIDDTYNANPGSMAGALETLAALSKDCRSFVVMGDMKELGRQAATLHRQVGSLAGGSGITGLLATGEFAEEMAAGAAEAGLENSRIFTGSKDQLAQWLIDRLQPEDWILVKGSRAMAMEEIVRKISEWATTKRKER